MYFPDLVILDVKLPDIDGFEVCRRIKSNPATSAIPVLHISTTFVDIEDKIHGLDSGADGYLTSVAEPMELMATVRPSFVPAVPKTPRELSKRQWQTTFDAISDGVLLLDCSGKVVQANRTLERILGRPWTDIVGKIPPSCGMNHPNPRAPCSTSMLTIRRPGGEGPRSGRLAGFMSPSTRYVTSQGDQGSDLPGLRYHQPQRMEMQALHQAEELEQDGRRKDEFLAMLAHELRNPLAPLANSCKSSAFRRREIRCRRIARRSRDARSTIWLDFSTTCSTSRESRAARSSSRRPPST